MIPPKITSTDFDHEHIRYGFFGRKGGVSQKEYTSLNCGTGSADDPACIQQNRSLIKNALYGEAICTPHQTHSDKAIFVERATTSAPAADAIVTRTSKLVIGVLTADCIPVLFHDPETHTIGAAHAGWRGALAGILENCVETMIKHGAHPENIRAIIGPCLQPPNFQIGADLYQAFTDKYPESVRFFSADPEPEKQQFHLTQFARWRLQNVGLEVAHLFGVQTCTLAQHDDFFSYRHSKQNQLADYGRNLSAICLHG